MKRKLSFENTRRLIEQNAKINDIIRESISNDKAISDAFENGKKECEKQEEQNLNPSKSVGLKEQKPKEPGYKHEDYFCERCQANAFNAGRESVLKEQKPAEWSEEDEEMLNSCISSIEESKENRYAYKETDGDTSYDREVDWLKSLRTQPKQEIYQSAKRDIAIMFMNYLDENRQEGKMGLSNGECEDINKAFEENDWAKILRYVEKYGKKN